MTNLSPSILWLLVCSVLFLAGSIGVFLCYYPLGTRIWKHRFRIVEGTDHVGPVLEIGFLCLVLGIVFLLSEFIYPHAGEMVITQIVNLERTLLTGIILVLVVFLVVVNVFICFINSPKEIFEEFSSDPSFREVYQSIVEEGKWEREKKCLRISYVPYYLYGVTSWLGYLFLLVLVFSGFFSDVKDLNEFTNDYGKVDFSAIDSAAGPSKQIDFKAITAEEENELLANANIQIIRFSAYQELLLDVVIRMVGACALVMLTFVWFLGTNFQKIYTPTVVTMCRYAALITMMSIPVVVLVFYFRFYFWERDTSLAFTSTALQISIDAGHNAGLMQKFNEVHNEFLNREAQYNFWLRIGSSWGGVLLVIEYLFSYIQKRFGNYNFFDGLRPRVQTPMGRLVRSIFVVGGEDEQPGETGEEQN